MGTHLRLLLFYCAIFTTISCAWGDSTSPTNCIMSPSLDEFRAYALKNSSVVREIDVAYANELADAFDHSVLINPELQAEQTFTGMKLQGANDGQTTVTLAQPFKFSNFGSRERVSNLIREAGDAQKQISLLEFTQDLNLQYLSLGTLEESVEILNRAKSRANKKIELIRDGVKKGLFNLGEEKLFEAESALLDAQLLGIEVQLSEFKAKVAKILGSNCEIRINRSKGKQENIPNINMLIEKSHGSKISENSRLKIFSKLANEKMETAKLDAFPTLSPRFVYQHTNDTGDFYGAGFTIPLPLWNRNQGEIMRATSMSGLVQQKQIFLDEGGLQNQLANLLNAATAAKAQSEIYTNKVVPNFKIALEVQEKIYTQGKGNILQVWQMQRALYESQMKELELWVESLKSRIKLSILVGEEI